VLFLGRLHPKKQPQIVIEAFARIADAIDNLHLVLAGPGEADYVERLRAHVEALGVGERTTFTGPLLGASVTEAYRAADVFALPSLQENFGIAIVEAMAAGCPVLVSKRVDIAAEIEATETGLVRPASVDEFAAALYTLMADGPMRERMGANGRRLVMERYTWGPIAQATVQAYEAVLRNAE
jgi:glycosyltransferase involved in cell wall biosynthesis